MFFLLWRFILPSNTAHFKQTIFFSFSFLLFLEQLIFVLLSKNVFISLVISFKFKFYHQLQTKKDTKTRHEIVNVARVQDIQISKEILIASLVQKLLQFCFMAEFCLFVELRREGSVVYPINFFRPSPTLFQSFFTCKTKGPHWGNW